MRLTLHTDYSLRVLMYVAAKDTQLSTIAEIAKSFAISKNHVMKVVYQLGKSGYLETVRGKNGGLRLLRKPAGINVGALVRELEDGVAILDCVGDPGYCRIASACVLRRAVRDATKAFYAVLDQYTLEDLVKPRSLLTSILQLHATAG